MDNTFIKMADCPEIQEGHIYKTGDLFADRWFIGVFIRDESYIYEIEGSPRREQWGTADIWLPTQSQLQEMVNGGFTHQTLERFYQWYHSGINKQLSSMEQLWLAFVMKERNKTWNGSEWVSG